MTEHNVSLTAEVKSGMDLFFESFPGIYEGTFEENLATFLAEHAQSFVRNKWNQKQAEQPKTTSQMITEIKQ